MSLTENAMLTAATREGLASRGFLKWGLAQEFAEKVIERFDVRTPGPQNAARSLSGGNLQKFVVGRELSQAPSVIVINQPTWGVDAAAAAAPSSESSSTNLIAIMAARSVSLTNSASRSARRASAGSSSNTACSDSNARP